MGLGLEYLAKVLYGMCWGVDALGLDTWCGRILVALDRVI